MSVPEKFRGYASFSKEEPMALKLYEYTPKQFDDHDVDIRITHCGVLTRQKMRADSFQGLWK
jgi:D-arabinose 1-dehydrogenase-like Zn-dependent alcohol dehydrogenase